MNIYLMIVLYFNTLIPSDKMQPPPGTKKVNDSLYLDIDLLSIESYDEFLYSIKINRDSFDLDYQKCLPDSNINYLGKPYLNSKQYKPNYPILNLNEYQIAEYCKWRSWAVNLWKNNPGNRSCSFDYWNKFDKVDSLYLTKVIYMVADSATINLYMPSKQINVPEKFRNEKSKVIKYVQKHFDQEVFGFRCVAKYVLRK